MHYNIMIFSLSAVQSFILNCFVVMHILPIVVNWPSTAAAETASAAIHHPCRCCCTIICRRWSVVYLLTVVVVVAVVVRRNPTIHHYPQLHLAGHDSIQVLIVSAEKAQQQHLRFMENGKFRNISYVHVGIGNPEIKSELLNFSWS